MSCSPFKDLGKLKEELKLEKFPTQEDYPEVDGVVIFESYDVNMDFDTNYDLFTNETVHVVKKLFKNIEDYASVEIPIYSDQQLREIQARTIKQDGTIIMLKKKDFYTITGQGDESVFYSDTKTVRFTFPAIEKGCIIEYKYTIRKDYPFRRDVWYIQNYIPTLRNQYRLAVPKILMEQYDWRWRYKSYNYEIGEPDVIKPISAEQSTLRQKIIFTWSLKDIPAFESERMMPPHNNYFGHVKFAPDNWRTWNDISSWYYKKLFEPQLILTDKIENLAKQITKNSNNDLDKIQNVYNYIQGLRYVAIELGIGGYQPSLPQIVLERQYGDCKDKSILLISLLKSLGITAKPVLVLTTSTGTIDSEFPSLNFNHMIVKAETKDGKFFWMDPTVKFCKLGELPWQCEGINVLILNEDGTSKMERTPYSNHDQNITDIEIQVSINSFKEASFKVSIKYKGEENFRNRHYFSDRTDKEMREFCKALIIDDYLNATISNYSFSNLDSLNSDLTLNFDFAIPNAIQQQGDLYFLNVDPFKLLDDMGWLLKEIRNYPIKFKYPYTIKKRITINFPERYFIIRNMPENIYLSSDNLSYNQKFNSNNLNQIVSEEIFVLKSSYILPEKYAQARKFFEQVKNKLNEKLIFNMKN
jgi:transglutaminase-like putative cysteine protease